MTIDIYLKQIEPLSIHARFSIGLRIFERYVRMRGLEDESIWEYLADMWKFPLLPTLEQKQIWGEARAELADYGLGDELPEELEEELYGLAISEDYFELWACNTTELAWTNLLQGPQDEESINLLRKLLELSVISKVAVPQVSFLESYLFTEYQGWGRTLTEEELEQWQAVPCDLQLEDAELDIQDHISEILKE